ncbi:MULTISPECIES: DNA primase [unclassified Treponema]|uniref:DNA primase n=1 Tax=unclassified Treponema TaxID=2638727 RepID=UPI0020A60D58|nr:MULTISPECIES: DNA primase [unclassified Treponema]UTC67798.1 DNA primase [Treponema sp. OMZ 789]UTC70523.1 DNA primase [Treponema sp. OMZ 790]UTC73235.1 DNA primase [Treponema sp. OMZ 791]
MPKISSKTIDAVTEMTDIVSLVENYTRLEKRGTNWWGCCPFHNEKTPSFNVVPDKRMYYCFGCHKGGGTINFLMEMEKLSFTEAVERLAKSAGIEVIYEGGSYVPDEGAKLKDEILELYGKVAGSFHFLLTQNPLGKKALDYLLSRNVSPEIIEKFNLGYSPQDRRWLHRFLLSKNYSESLLEKTGLFSKNYKNTAFFSDRLMFPICDRHGKTIAFGGRILEGEGPKYLNSSDMPQYKKGETVFAFHHALAEIRKSKSVILCEGYMDVLAFFQAGIENAVAPLGTALTEDQVKLLKSFAETFYLAFDSDSAGQEASYKAIKLCRSLGVNVRVLYMKDGKDPSEILQKKGKDGLKFLLDCAIIDDDYLIQIASMRFDISSPEGKARAIAFLFPYIEVLESDIQRESAISKLSSAFGVSQQAIFGDYVNREKKALRHIVDEVKQKPVDIRMNAELRLVLAVAANPDLFSRLRSELSSDDFEDFYARYLFIVLEECYREGAYTYANLMHRCGEEKLKDIVSQTISKGEFADNSEKVVSDGINFIKQNILQKQKDKIIGRLRLLHGEKNIDTVNLTKELMEEKKSIDIQLKNLKGKAYD